MLATSFGIAQTSNYPIGSTVDDFTVVDTQGETHHLYAYTAAGKHVMLDFFFYNCGPCQINAPYYNQLFETYGCNGGDLICISVNNGSDTDALAEQFGVDFGGDFAHPPTVGQVQGGALTDVFGVSYSPTFCLIGTDNKIKDDDVWPLSNGMASLVASFPAGSGIQPMACATSIGEYALSAVTEVYPNPTSGTVTLNMTLDRTAPVRLEVLDLLGKTVLRSDLGTLMTGNTTRNIDLGALANGQYLLRAFTGDKLTSATRIALAR